MSLIPPLQNLDWASALLFVVPAGTIEMKTQHVTPRSAQLAIQQKSKRKNVVTKLGSRIPLPTRLTPCKKPPCRRKVLRALQLPSPSKNPYRPEEGRRQPLPGRPLRCGAGN